MATHSSILARRIPQTEEPGGLPSLGSHTTEMTWQQQQYFYQIKQILNKDCYKKDTVTKDTT